MVLLEQICYPGRDDLFQVFANIYKSQYFCYDMYFPKNSDLSSNNRPAYVELS